MKTYRFAFRVNDTNIKHLTLTLKTDREGQAINTAIRRLEKQGYTVNELVWIRTVVSEPEEGKKDEKDP